MKEIIKKYISLIGFVIAAISIGISEYYKYYSNDELKMLGDLGGILLITTLIIGMELKNKKPKNWLIYITIGLFFTTILFYLFS
jgi:predicted Kef-type K+ transport protein